MQITLKNMKLTFYIKDNTWDRVITDMNGNKIWEYLDLPILEEDKDIARLNAWKEQMCALPVWNIVDFEIVGL